MDFDIVDRMETMGIHLGEVNDLLQIACGILDRNDHTGYGKQCCTAITCAVKLVKDAEKETEALFQLLNDKYKAANEKRIASARKAG